MRSFILLLAIFAIARSFPLRLMETPVSDIPDCAADLQADFTHLETAISAKSWNEVFALIKNVSKTYADCKDGYNQVSVCIADAKVVASNVADLVNAVKSKDLNPFHYITMIKALFADTKKFTADCYVKKPTSPFKGVPQDLAKCGSDLKGEFQDLVDAFTKKDMSRVDDLFSKFSQTFVDCQVAYEDVAECTAPVIGTVTDIVNLIKYAEAKDMNPLHYVEAVKSLVGNVEGVVHQCFNR
jgi:uncharacterized protein YqgV (UPF0045/DUF77 family)